MYVLFLVSCDTRDLSLLCLVGTTFCKKSMNLMAWLLFPNMKSMPALEFLMFTQLA